MPILHQYLFAVGSFQGILLACLLVFGTQVSNGSRILGVWCLFLALRFLGSFITMDGELNMFSSLIGLSFFLPAAYGALMYLYCRHALIDRPLTLNDMLHFSPFLLCYLLNIDVFLLPPEAKLAIVVGHNVASTGFLVSQFIMFAQAFVYLGLSARLIYSYRNEATHTLSSFNPDIFRWLWTLLILDLIIWLLKGAAVVFDYNYVLFLMGDILIIVLIYSIAMAQWRNPRLFKIDQLEIAPDLSEQSPLSASEHSAKQPSGIKNSGALEQSTRVSLLKEVQQHMTKNETFRDNQLTLTSLAQAIGVTTHHLSEVLNQQEGKNFYQFVNEYRIDYVRRKMEMDRSTKILDLAMTAGFSSKSTFNAVFKQFTGLTPSQYRSNLAN